MLKQPSDDCASLVIGSMLGILIAAVLATPFYGFAPVLTVVGALFVAAIVIRVVSGPT